MIIFQGAIVRKCVRDPTKKTVRAQKPFDAKSVRAFAILCVRNVHMYVFGNTVRAYEV